MRAVICHSGRQFTVSPGDHIAVDRLEGEPGSSTVFDNVILVSSGEAGSVIVGTPRVQGAKVNAKIIKHAKGPKVEIYKKKRRTGYEKSQGHRQLHTHVLIEEIVASR